MKQLSYDEIAQFCMKLYLLISAGLNDGDAVDMASDGDSSDWLMNMRDKVLSGSTLSEAMNESGVFPVYVCGLVETGERTGGLADTLKIISEHYDRLSKFNKQLRNALTYPVAMLVLMLTVVGVVLTEVMPVFDDMYSMLGVTMSGVSGLLLTAGSWLRTVAPALAVFVAALILCAVLLAKVDKFKQKAVFLLKERIGRWDIIKRVDNARIVQVLALGVSSSMDFRDCLLLASSVVADIPDAVSRCQRCLSLLDDGYSHGLALAESGILDESRGRLLDLGERGGSAELSINKIASDMMFENETDLSRLASRTELILVIICSAAVGSVLFSVMLPLLDVMSVIN